MKTESQKLTALTFWLWPLGWGAVAINLFFLSLIGSWVGLPVMPPLWAAILAMPLGWPFARAFARHFRKLVHDVDRKQSLQSDEF